LSGSLRRLFVLFPSFYFISHHHFLLISKLTIHYSVLYMSLSNKPGTNYKSKLCMPLIFIALHGRPVKIPVLYCGDKMGPLSCLSTMTINDTCKNHFFFLFYSDEIVYNYLFESNWEKRGRKRQGRKSLNKWNVTNTCYRIYRLATLTRKVALKQVKIVPISYLWTTSHVGSLLNFIFEEFCFLAFFVNTNNKPFFF